MHAVTSGGGLERDCCFSQRTADKAFGRKGLANDCIPHNPWTAIFTPKEPPIVSFCSGWNRKDWFGPRLWSPSRSSHPSWTSCSVCTSMQGPRCRHTSAVTRAQIRHRKVRPCTFNDQVPVQHSKVSGFSQNVCKTLLGFLLPVVLREV